MPASNLEVLKTAVHYGADAVYIGGDAYGLRAAARNFNSDEMREGIRFAHAHHVKVYVTVNIFAHNKDLAGIAEYLEELQQIGPDALIISDPGVFDLARQHAPDLDIHISTQANNTNSGTFGFWHRLGAKRVVCARELSLDEIRQIISAMPEGMETEVFIHGAMCMAYSGRCLMSAYMTGRDANRGACTHPCRWSYSVIEQTRPGEELPVYENERGSFVFHSKDLCMIDHIPDMLDAGIDCYKVEGRMKNALYVATVGRAYRNAIDTCMKDRGAYEQKLGWYLEQVKSCTYRDFCTGFFYGRPSDDAQVYEGSAYHAGRTYLGIVGDTLSDHEFMLEQKNKFSKGDMIEIMGFSGGDRKARVISIKDAEGNEQESAPHAKQMLRITLSEPVQSGEILRSTETCSEESR